MHTDNLHKGQEAREKLIAGIQKVAEAVGSTMGTSGSNGLIEMMENPGHVLTNDGITIAQSIKLADPIEEMGRKILLEAISRANKASGDGSSTTCVLTSAILREGLARLNEEWSPMDIKRSLENCVPLIEKSIEDQKQEIWVEYIDSVASISAEDEEIGKTIKDIYSEIGKEGIIHWDISKTGEDHYSIGKGIVIEGATVASPYMNDRDASGAFLNTASFKNPLIILTKEKITSAAVFEKLFPVLNAKGKKEVVIFCDDYDVNVITQLVMTQQVQGFRAVIIKMPILWGDWWFTDIAKATGATIIDPSAGLSLKDAEEKHLGKCDNLRTDRESTYLDGILDVSEHLKALEEEGTEESAIRIARLNTKTARYYVGAQSDSALSYRRLKVEDAISASYQALHHGIVAGGGVAIKNASLTLPDTIGGNILRESLKTPLKTILYNCGQYDLVYKQLSERSDNIGFDTKTKTEKDMLKGQIVDPASVVLNAVKNAVSVAATILTAETIITLPKQDEKMVH